MDSEGEGCEDGELRAAEEALDGAHAVEQREREEERHGAHAGEQCGAGEHCCRACEVLRAREGAPRVKRERVGRPRRQRHNAHAERRQCHKLQQRCVRCGDRGGVRESALFVCQGKVEQKHKPKDGYCRRAFIHSLREGT